LNLGLKFDVDNIPASIQDSIKNGHIDFNDPATTLGLLRANAVIGLNGFFDGNTLKSVGLTCALCHSMVDDSLMPGFGHRLDGCIGYQYRAIVMAAPTTTDGRFLASAFRLSWERSLRGDQASSTLRCS
jgi:hypothetical protein